MVIVMRTIIYLQVQYSIKALVDLASYPFSISYVAGYEMRREVRCGGHAWLAPFSRLVGPGTWVLGCSGICSFTHIKDEL
jgi:hypothetical protein